MIEIFNCLLKGESFKGTSDICTHDVVGSVRLLRFVANLLCGLNFQMVGHKANCDLIFQLRY